MAPALPRRSSSGRSIALALLLSQLPGARALRSVAYGATGERAQRRTGLSKTQRDREAKTLGGSRDVWLLDGSAEALRAAHARNLAVPAVTEDSQALLQKSSGERRQRQLPSFMGHKPEESEEAPEAPQESLQSEEASDEEQSLIHVVSMAVPMLQGTLKAVGASEEDVLRFGQELDPEKLQSADDVGVITAFGYALKVVEPEKLKAAAPALAVTLGAALKSLGPEKLKALGPSLLAVLKTVVQERLEAAGRSLVTTLEGVAAAAAANAQNASAQAQQAPSKPDDVESQVQALMGHMEVSHMVRESAKVAAGQLNSSAVGSTPVDAAKGLQALFAASAGAMDWYKGSVGDLQTILLNATGPNVPTFLFRYNWMDSWKKAIQALGDIYRLGEKSVVNSTMVDASGGVASAELCPFLGLFVPLLHNVTIGYVAQLTMVVNDANKNATIGESEPIKTGVNMISSAMAAMKAEGIFLEEDGVTEQVCRSTVFVANSKFGCKLVLPWAPPQKLEDLKLSPEDEKKLAEATKEMVKMSKGGVFMATKHRMLTIIMLSACGVGLFLSLWKCLQLPLILFVVPFYIIFEIVKGLVLLAFGIVFGTIGVVVKILVWPFVCCFGRTKNQESALDGLKESESTGIPTEVLDKMPQHEKILQKGTDFVKATAEAAAEGGLEGVLNSLQQPLSSGGKARANPESAPEGSAAAAGDQQNNMEHPLYSKLGLSPVAALRKHYERKK
uniref:Uncharacterized protein n=1 Tax=Alexandrium catenella TaxID=2925 RepID=A0A7S1WSA0_ALECA|mmetsp:Transcript_86680/g.230301  ORF Transcript_86680/g.230301 Transcript_86680/m.230301 type:complete len:731 (+) Transcript_86680:64-2256(+)